MNFLLLQNLAENVLRLLNDMSKLKTEMENPEHIAELCFLEGDIKDIQEILGHTPSSDHLPYTDPNSILPD